MGKSDGTVYVVGLDGDVIDALNGSTWQRTEVYAGGRHLATVTLPGVVFTHSDWIGTERARTNPLGELCQFSTSEPFGDSVQTGVPAGGARYFNSMYGRWMSPDFGDLARLEQKTPLTSNAS